MKKKAPEQYSRRQFLTTSAHLLVWSQLGAYVACSDPKPGEEKRTETPADSQPDAGPDSSNPDVTAGLTYPRAAIPPGMAKDALKQKIKEEPFAGLYKRVQDRLKQEIRQPKPGTWESSVNEHNAENAVAAAFLAWLNDDKAAADKAHENIATFGENWSDNEVWDMNIRMPAPLIHYTETYDYLKATEFFTDEQAKKLKATLLSVTEQFYDEYILKASRRGLVLTPAQNNHPIRTACAIGYVAMYFADEPKTKPWLDWALSELDYLWSKDGKYVMTDGGVTEGPFYYRFALGPSLMFFLAAERLLDPKQTYKRDCINRNNVDPWTGHGCEDGTPFTFENPLRSKHFQGSIDWSLALRLPTGHRAPIADSYLRIQGGSALMIPYGAPAYHYWDWASNPQEPFYHGGGMNLTVQHILYTQKPDKIAPPEWTNRFFPETGHAVFRSGWEADDRFLVLLAESGASRKTLHDQVDGTSFILAAYGELLLSDSGYYKTAGLQQPETANAGSHNVILINGNGAPRKGLINNWGDADAFLENTKDGKLLAWAEARQTYEKTDIVRGIAFVRQRYYVVADRLSTQETKEREHTFRLHGYAGFDLKDSKAELLTDGPHVQRQKGGLYAYIQSTAGTPKHEEPAFRENKAPHVHNLDGLGAHFVSDSKISAVAPGFLSVLAPYKAGADASSLHGPLEVKKVDCGADATGWTIKTTEGTDFAWLRGPGAAGEVTLPDGNKAQTDAAFALFSLDGKLAMISRGTKLSYNGKTLVDKDVSKGVELIEA